MELKDLGFDSWVEAQADSVPRDEIARVVTVDKNSYMIKNSADEMRAEITGKLMFAAESALDYPTVGDWVHAQFFDDDSFAVIHQVLPRKTILKRKAAGKRVEFQLIAANIDTGFLMQSLDANFNPKRLERYLVMLAEGKIDPVVLLSKSDLMSQEEIDSKIAEIHQTMPRLPIVAFSNETGTGLDHVMNFLKPGKTHCLLGSSGVGKTTLLNALIGDEVLRTQSVREKDRKGRHTTTRRQLLFIDNGAMVIDTPGMRELGNLDIERGLDQVFDEIAVLAENCRFPDCSHLHETGCAVLEAVRSGELSQERYQNYVKMTKEASHYEMSYLEKKKRDRSFGKMIKNFKKNSGRLGK